MLLAKRTFLRSERHMDDVELKRAVESELNFEPRIIAAEIGEAVKDGVVTLTSRGAWDWLLFDGVATLVLAFMIWRAWPAGSELVIAIL